MGESITEMDNIRLVVENDHIKIKNTISAFKNVYSAYVFIQNPERYYQTICDNSIFIVALIGNVVCGFCAFYANNADSREAFISLIAVRPEFQKKGIGRMLINYACEMAKQRGMRTIRLEVNKANEKAKAFYRTNGFAVCQDEKNSIYMNRRIL